VITPRLLDDAPACVMVSCALAPTSSGGMTTTLPLVVTRDLARHHVRVRLIACSRLIRRNACFSTRVPVPRSP
jgi:hypothetical protein